MAAALTRSSYVETFQFSDDRRTVHGYAAMNPARL